MILQWQLNQRLIHQIDVASPAHSKMQERDQQIPDLPGLHASFQARRVIQRDARAELFFAQFHNICVIVGDFRKVGALEKEVDAIDLGCQKDGFRIIVRDHDPGSGEQMGDVDSAPDVFRNLTVALEEVHDRAIHKLETDLKRWSCVDLREWLAAQ